MSDGPVSPWSVPLSVVTYTVPSAPTARPPGAPGEPTGANTVIEPGGSGAAVDAGGGGSPVATSVDAPAAVERSPTPVALGPGVAGTKVGGGAGPVAGAEVGGHDQRVRSDLLGGALGDAPARGQAVDAVGDRHHERHVVLDQHDGRAQLGLDALDERAERLGLALRHACSGLV